MDGERPPVSVVVPFLGDRSDAERALAALSALHRRPGDEVIVADNTGGEFAATAGGDAGVTVVLATDERSAHYARNVGAERAATDWLLFVDADCRPAPSLIDDYFSAPVADGVGAVSGSIDPDPDGDAVAARWAASREVLSQARALELPGGPAGATGNLLVRRAAWAEVGGFHEGVPVGTEVEFCWRLQDAGWRFEHRPGARVEHPHREDLGAVLRQFSGYAAGDAWLNRRRPGSVPRLRLPRSLGRALVGVPGFAVTGQFDRARMKAIDAAVVSAQALGSLRGNAARREVPAPAPGPGLVIATDYFPALTEQFVTRELAALTGAGKAVRIEAVARPERPLEGGARGLRVNWLEDEGTLDRVAGLAALAARHPLRCLADLARRRRFDAAERMPLRALAPAARRLEHGGERHVHVHFAGLAAANALRIGWICSVPVSVNPHAHEIYAEPRGLGAKLAHASFVSTVCDYNVERLRAVGPPEARARIHNAPIGIDCDAVRRRGPQPGGREVLAVGRLVEQKGFRHLIEAAAELAGSDPVTVTVAGGGPLRGELEAMAARLGVADAVTFTGAVAPRRVRELMEVADLLAVPSVIAADGNRDALPVVVLEALAMELPVVASDEVGLPEVVRPPWGRLVPPGDPDALAAAIRELLALPASERAELGAAGRDFVCEQRSLRASAERLLELIETQGNER